VKDPAEGIWALEGVFRSTQNRQKIMIIKVLKYGTFYSYTK